MIPVSTFFSIEVKSDFPQWWRYNVFLMAVGFDRSGERVSFNSLSDKIYDVDVTAHDRTAPNGYDTARPIILEAGPCSTLELYVYVVANTFPRSERIADSPPFPVLITVTAANGHTEDQSYEVNQFGGLTVAGIKFSGEES